MIAVLGRVNIVVDLVNWPTMQVIRLDPRILTFDQTRNRLAWMRPPPAARIAADGKDLSVDKLVALRIHGID